MIGGIDGISTVNAYIRNVLSAFSSAGITSNPSFKKPSFVFSGTQGVVSITDMGRQFSLLYQDLQSSHNKSAMEGLRAISAVAYTSPGDTSISGFLQTANDLKVNDRQSYLKLFTTAGLVDKGGFNTHNWVDTYVSLSGNTAQNDFVNATKTIVGLGNGNDEKGLMNDYMNTLSSIRRDATFTDTQKDLLTNKLNNGIISHKTTSDISAFLDDFKRTNPM